MRDAVAARATCGTAGAARGGVWRDAVGELVRDAVEACSWRRSCG